MRELRESVEEKNPRELGLSHLEKGQGTGCGKETGSCLIFRSFRRKKKKKKREKGTCNGHLKRQAWCKKENKARARSRTIPSFILVRGAGRVNRSGTEGGKPSGGKEKVQKGGTEVWTKRTEEYTKKNLFNGETLLYTK